MHKIIAILKKILHLGVLPDEVAKELADGINTLSLDDDDPEGDKQIESSMPAQYLAKIQVEMDGLSYSARKKKAKQMQGDAALMMAQDKLDGGFNKRNWQVVINALRYY
jgi:hypothetical protein